MAMLAYRAHRNKWLAYYVIPSSILLQIVLVGLVAGSVRRSRDKAIVSAAYEA